jgi:ribosome-associated heat shock protein Hsp15
MTNESPPGMRLDKWLWAARFYKSRGLAQNAIEAGHVKVNEESVRSSRDIRPGDKLSMRIGEYTWDVTVRALEMQRGPAPDARELYEEDEDSLARRAQAMEARKLERKAEPQHQQQQQQQRRGRPDKRDRRAQHRFRGR